MTPDEQVAESICAEFKKAHLLSEGAVDKLKSKLATGALSGADWKIIFDTDRPKKKETGK